jgi:hypothetical protein
MLHTLTQKLAAPDNRIMTLDRLDVSNGCLENLDLANRI